MVDYASSAVGSGVTDATGGDHASSSAGNGVTGQLPIGGSAYSFGPYSNAPYAEVNLFNAQPLPPVIGFEIQTRHLRSKPLHPSLLRGGSQRYPRQHHHTPPDTAGTPVNKFQRFLPSKPLHPSLLNGRTTRWTGTPLPLIPLSYKLRRDLRSKPPHPTWIDGRHQRYPRQHHHTPPDTAGTPVNKFYRFLKSQPLHPSLLKGHTSWQVGKTIEIEPPTINYFRTLRSQPPHPSWLRGHNIRYVRPELIHPPTIEYFRHLRSKPLHPSMYNGNIIRSGAVLIIKYGSIETSITFTSDVQRQMEFSRSLDDSITFGQYNDTNIKYSAVESTIAFSPTLARNVEYNRTVEHTIRFDQVAKRTIEAAVTSLVTFALELGKGGDVESTINFGQTVVADRSTAVETPVTFDVDIERNVEYGRDVESTLTFGIDVQGYVESDCGLGEYLPIGASLEPVTQGIRGTVIFSRGGDDVELRNPEFGNVEAHDIRRILRETRGGTTRAGQRSIWAKEVNLSLSFSGLTKAKAEELIVFVKDNIGQQIDYLDQENQAWTGVILSVTDPMVDIRGTDCFYSVTVEYVANRQ